MDIDIKPIGFVKAARTLAEDDFWGGEEACIALAEPFTPEALQGLASFSHAEESAQSNRQHHVPHSARRGDKLICQ